MFYFACFVFNADSFVCQCDCFMVILLFLGLSLVILDLGGHCLVLLVCVLFLCAILVILDLLSFCIHLWALCILFGHLKSNSEDFYSLFAVFIVTLSLSGHFAFSLYFLHAEIMACPMAC